MRDREEDLTDAPRPSPFICLKTNLNAAWASVRSTLSTESPSSRRMGGLLGVYIFTKIVTQRHCKRACYIHLDTK